MRGFLQHITAVASRREPTVHPFIGAMFQNSSWEEGAPPITEQETAGKVKSTEVAAAFMASPAHPTTVEPRRFEPLVPRNTAEVSAAGWHEREPTGPDRKDAADPNVGAKTSKHREETLREVAQTQILPETAPLVLQPLLSSEISQGNEISQNIGTAERRIEEKRRALTPRVTRRQTPERVASPQAEGHAIEDIQIHIGRIEVTAVPPPAPRAPAARARKAMSLDDYLKRRNGRAQ